MGSYFKPWRRKIGVVSLGLACSLMVGWVRSAHFDDGIVLDTTSSFLAMHSRRFKLYFSNCTLKDPTIVITPPLSPGSFNFGSREFDHGEQENFETAQVLWRRQLCGFDVGKTQGTRSSTVMAIVPYSHLVVPLTLFAAWLLLSKPRKKDANSAPQISDSR